MRRAALALLALLAVPALSPAQPVYRCGSAYSSTPCREGQAVDASDPRTAEQRREAQRAAKQDAKAAAQLERERHAREAGANGQAAGGFYTLPRAASAPLPAASAAKGKKKKPKTPTYRQRV